MRSSADPNPAHALSRLTLINYDIVRLVSNKEDTESFVKSFILLCMVILFDRK